MRSRTAVVSLACFVLGAVVSLGASYGTQFGLWDYPTGLRLLAPGFLLGLAGSAQVVSGEVARSFGRIARSGPFDLVFADPPWALVDAGEADGPLATLARESLLAEEATVVLEHSARTDPREVEGLSRHSTRRYGDTALTFYKPAILGALRQ